MRNELLTKLLISPYVYSIMENNNIDDRSSAYVTMISFMFSQFSSLIQPHATNSQECLYPTQRELELFMLSFYYLIKACYFVFG